MSTTAQQELRPGWRTGTGGPTADCAARTTIHEAGSVGVVAVDAAVEPPLPAAVSTATTPTTTASTDAGTKATRRGVARRARGRRAPVRHRRQATPRAPCLTGCSTNRHD